MWGQRNSGLPNSFSEGASKTRTPQHQALHKTTTEWGRDGKVLPTDAGGAACLVPSGASFGADRCPHFGLCFIPGCHVAPAGGIYMKGVGERRGMRVDRATGKG